MRRTAIAVALSGVLALSLGAVAYGSTTTGESATPVPAAEIDMTQYPVDRVFPKMAYQEEGYKDFQTWWQDLLNAQSKFANCHDSAVEGLKEYISDEDMNRLYELEQLGQNALTLTAIYDYEEEYNDILNRANEAKEEAERVVEVTVEESSNTSTASSYAPASGAIYSVDDIMFHGVVEADGFIYTYYSERVLPGGGLNIPGRHTSNGFVRDENEYIVAASANPDYRGAVFSTSFGMVKVYDFIGSGGRGSNHLDLYTW